MGLLNFFKRLMWGTEAAHKEPPLHSSKSAKQTRGSKAVSLAIPEDRVDDIVRALGRVDSKDYLGMAADTSRRAGEAVEAGDYSKAWGLYHEVKQLYLKHAVRSQFTTSQTRALDGAVNGSLANILRLEGKHSEALVHMIYSLATSPKQTKAGDKSLLAYFKRARLASATIDEVRDFISSIASSPDLRAIQLAIKKWETRPK